MSAFIISVDLGQNQDYTALCVLQWHRASAAGESNRYDLRHLERFELGTAYPDQVHHIESILGKKPLRGQTDLVVDATGVGRPIVDMMKRRGLRPRSIWITGGDAVQQDGFEYRVPKRELASAVQAHLQSGTLRFADGLRYGPLLKEELKNFRVKVNIATGHDRYEHHREGQHDDLVLALAMGVWYGDRQGMPWSAFPCIKASVN